MVLVKWSSVVVHWWYCSEQGTRSGIQNSVTGHPGLAFLGSVAFDPSILSCPWSAWPCLQMGVMVTIASPLLPAVKTQLFMTVIKSCSYQIR